MINSISLYLYLSLPHTLTHTERVIILTHCEVPVALSHIFTYLLF